MAKNFINPKCSTDLSISKYPRLWAAFVMIEAFFNHTTNGAYVDVTGTYVVPASKAVVSRAEEQLKDAPFGDVVTLAHTHQLTRPDTEAGAILRHMFEATWADFNSKE
jgi:hypothetical protein